MDMGKDRRRAMRHWAIVVGAVLAVSPPSPVVAQGQRAAAGGAVEISEAVGAGIAYDLLTDILSTVFLSGRTGDSVSLLLPERSGSGSRLPNEVVVLSTAYYRMDVASGVARAIVANPDAKVGLTPLRDGGGPDNFLVLAQFN